MNDEFKTLRKFDAGRDREGFLYSLPALEEQRVGRDPKIIEPLVPVDLVVDHSVQVDFFGSARALELNLDMEFKRNRERYQFLKWGQQAFKTFQLIPPGIGIVHQVNLEYLGERCRS